MDDSGNILVYRTGFKGTSKVIVYDTNNRKVSHEYFPGDSHSSIYNLKVSGDGNTICCCNFRSGSDFEIIALENNNGDFSRFSLQIVSDLYSDFFITSNGERIIYQAVIGTFYKNFIVDRNENGWRPPEEMKIGEYELIKIFDMAENGKTILADIKGIGLSLLHEKNGVWTDVERLNYTPQGLEYYFLSENGKMVAYNAHRYPVTEENRDYYNPEDLFVCLKKDHNEWEKIKLNRDGTDLWSGFQLSKNGKKIFWASGESAKIKDWPEMK